MSLKDDLLKTGLYWARKKNRSPEYGVSAWELLSIFRYDIKDEVLVIASIFDSQEDIVSLNHYTNLIPFHLFDPNKEEFLG